MATDNSCANNVNLNLNGKPMVKKNDGPRLNEAQSKEFLGMKYAGGVKNHKFKTRRFNVISFEHCTYEQIVDVPEVYVDGQYDESETRGLAVDKAGEIGDWGTPEFGEVIEQTADEIAKND